MDNPNYENTQGKHPIPHAEGIAKDEERKNDDVPETTVYTDAGEEEE